MKAAAAPKTVAATPLLVPAAVAAALEALEADGFLEDFLAAGFLTPAGVFFAEAGFFADDLGAAGAAAVACRKDKIA
jgi:hypothetical protein